MIRRLSEPLVKRRRSTGLNLNMTSMLAPFFAFWSKLYCFRKAASLEIPVQFNDTQLSWGDSNLSAELGRSTLISTPDHLDHDSQLLCDASKATWKFLLLTVGFIFGNNYLGFGAGKSHVHQMSEPRPGAELAVCHLLCQCALVCVLTPTVPPSSPLWVPTCK